jgi:hypothetical protein
MSKIVFDARKSKQEIGEELQILNNTSIFLKSYLQKILDKKQSILKKEELFFHNIGYMRFGFKYFVDDFVNLPLGILIKLWEDGTLIKPCDKCNDGKVHIFVWTVFIGHEKHRHYKGVCNNCKEIIDVYDPEIDDFNDKFDHVKKIISNNQNVEIKNIIKPGIPQHFSWSKGLVAAIPEIAEIIKEKAIPVDRETLIKVLKNGKHIKKQSHKVSVEPVQKFHGKPKVIFSNQKDEGLINI